MSETTGKLIDYIVQPTYNGAEVKVVRLTIPTPQAELAMTLIERWGMVAGDVDGEDSAGRQKIRLQTPDELIERACKTAEAAMAEFQQRGWMMAIPKPDPEDDQFMDELRETKAKIKKLRDERRKEEEGSSDTEAA